MINARWATVDSIVRQRGDLCELLVSVDGSRYKAANFESLTGRVEAGDRVLLNTTAVDLGLGSGGFHFVMAVNGPGGVSEAGGPSCDVTPGHIMKLRYTPLQTKVLAAEEEASPLRTRIEATRDLAGMPVVVGSLHSCLAPVVLGISETAGRPVKIAYVMTDGAALPVAWSATVSALTRLGLIEFTVTAGQAFGGDYEAVNKHSALLTAKAAGAEVAVVALGPGIVGTGTKYGHTGLEQGEVVDAVNLLAGRPVAVARLSFADARPRHRGLSHHFLTALGEIAHTPATVGLPALPPDLDEVVSAQLRAHQGMARHRIVSVNGGPVREAAERYGLKLTSMGRGYSEDPYCFDAGWAAGVIAAQLLAQEA